jgi:hypothetical protein
VLEAGGGEGARGRVFVVYFPLLLDWTWGCRLGERSRRRERFVIRLNRHQSQQQAVETLCHEWAHALAWSYSLDKLARDPHITSEQFEQASHDEAWGCAYARVWRAYLAAGRTRIQMVNPPGLR